MWPGYGDWQWMLGAVLGFFAGWTLKWQTRKTIEAQVAVRLKEAVELAAYAADESKKATSALRSAQRVAPGDAQTDVQPAPYSAPASATATRTEAAASVASVAPVVPALTEALAARSAAPPPADARTSNETGDLWDEPIPAGTQRAQPAAPVGPPDLGFINTGAKAAMDWLLGGNTVVRVGLVVLFIGLAFLARFAATQGLFPVELRMAAIAAAGIALLVIGFKKRNAKPGFALALQGAGVAVLYLAIFSALRLYGLIPPIAAFGLLIVVCALGCALALLQDSRLLAVASFAGGFAAPILVSTGQGNHVGLFSYYLVLNLAIMGIAHQRGWRLLNLVGFFATFVVATTWGVLRYQNGDYLSTQLFLAAFVLIFIATAVLYARNTPTKLGNAVDSTLVFGTPLIGITLQAGLVKDMPFGLSFSALALSAVYLVLATVLMRRAKDSYRLLTECFIALGVGFLTMAVPLALDARWTSLTWTLEAIAAFWVGMRQARWMPRAFALALHGFATLSFFSKGASVTDSTPFLHAPFLGGAVLAATSMLLAWWLRKDLLHSDSKWAKMYVQVENKLSSPLFILGFVLICLAWASEFHRTLLGYAHAYPEPWGNLLLAFAVVLTMAASHWASRRLNWDIAARPAMLALPVLAMTWFANMVDGHRLLHHPDWLLWLGLLFVHVVLMRQQEHTNAKPLPKLPKLPKILTFLHVASVWFILLLLAECLWFGISRAELWQSAWSDVVWLVSATAVVGALTLWAGRKAHLPQPHTRWPLVRYARAYHWYAAVPVAGLTLMLALWVSVSSSGNTAPLPYIPLLNPTEIAVGLALAVLMLWWRTVLAAQPRIATANQVQPQPMYAVAAVGFIAINCIWLRIAHHFFDVPWDASALFASFVVQTGYSILWALIALVCMVFAHKTVKRSLWMVGAAALGVVVLKLLAIDLSNQAGAERIISFIGVGVLMLLVGYFAPLPPKVAPSPPKPEPAADLPS
jgi:uncharacterized membrane protein